MTKTPRWVPALWAIASLTTGASAQTLESFPPASRSELRRIVEPGGFLTSSVPVMSHRASCQPVRGDLVAVGTGVQPVGDVIGALMVPVRVLSGPCKNTAGWIGQHRLSSEGAGR